ncbi:hypothetical protein [Streptomyces fagopyri]|uniref:hypothetical protein n=1 Tax=Streptomyces fagopyri TaxID=2662397 RepID=UPI0033C06AB4
MTNTTSNTAGAVVPTDELLSPVRDLRIAGRWDLGLLRLRHGYRQQVHVDGVFRAGPDGKDHAVLAAPRAFGAGLRDRAPDTVRRGWAELYLGLIADNLFAEREFAPRH